MESDFDNSALGKVTVDRFDTRAAYSIKQGENKLVIGGLYEFSRYDLTKGLEDLDFNRLGLDALYQGMCNENWGYFGYAGGQLSASDKASLSKGAMGTFGGGARYVHSPSLSVNFGLAYATSLEDDNYFIPIIMLNWQIDEHWAVRTFNGATVSYDIGADKKNLLDLGANIQRREYRLQKNSDLGVSGSDASLIEKSVNIEFGYTHRFTDNFALRSFVGMVTGRNREVRAHNDKIGQDQDIDSALSVGVRGLLTF